MFLRPSLSYLILFIICKLLYSSVTCARFTNETDLEALLAIKNLLSADSQGASVFSSWNDSQNFCHWNGVICTNSIPYRVSELNLSSYRLVGTLAPHIGNFSFLSLVDLSKNQLHGNIPPQLGQLFHLQHLYLDANSFEGELPADLAHCLSIKNIDASQNNLTGLIPAALGTLPSLSDLTLSSNQFSGMIPASFVNLSSLQYLFLSQNNLQGSIPPELGRLPNLEVMQLGVNNLSGLLPSSLYNISSMKYFAIAKSQFTGTLPPDLGLAFPKLQHFLIGLNRFYGTIPPSLANTSGLIELDISDNAFVPPVPMNLGGLHQLERLYFNNNPLGTSKDGDLNFVDSLINCTSLYDLDLAYNNFGGALPGSIANLSTALTSLTLQDNQIYGSIPPEIGKLVNLNFLAFCENKLTGFIPESIGKISALQVLALYTNGLSGQIPFSIGNITQLNLITLHDNMLEGTIPVSLSNCTNLQGLDLGYNHLVGRIPEQIFGLPLLSIALNLNHNYLIGSLPSQIGNLINLGALAVSENKLSGEIPGSLGSCVVMESLSMQSNLFEGNIPSSFRKLRGLQYLDLSNNNLSGQIPSFLADFSLIEYLNLSFNQFEGPVPYQGVFRNASAFSVAENQQLCGGIQALRLPPCPNDVPKKERKHFPHKFIPLVIILPVVFILVCLLAFLCRVKRPKQPSHPTFALMDQHPKLTYAELQAATNGFSSANLIGQGRYGSVYTAVLSSSDKIVAVKVLNLHQHGAHKSFMAECEALRNIRHRNLVKLITSCSSIDRSGYEFQALVFEFMPNGSLESWLHPSLSDDHGHKTLNFLQRLNIAVDVASALEYLHHQCETAIIHCDLKPSNVLLDNDLCAHIGDFGLARILSPYTAGQSNHIHSSTIAIRGTVGYIPPEYGMGSEVSTQGDIFSYGIFLLEMFTAKRPTDDMFSENFSLHSYVKKALPEGVMDIVDQNVLMAEKEASNTTTRSRRGDTASKMLDWLVSIMQIGIQCSVDLSSERMNARDILVELNAIRNAFLGLRQQAFE